MKIVTSIYFHSSSALAPSIIFDAVSKPAAEGLIPDMAETEADSKAIKM